MVEKPLHPVHRAVAGSAIFVVAVFMRVVFEMTVVAYFRRITKYMRFMTGLALRRHMRAQKREAHQIMIEKDIVLPRRFVVAVIAHNALFPFMWVIVCVAVVAGCLKRDLKYRLDMAIETFDRLVRTDQPMFGIGVVIEENCCPDLSAVAGVALIGEVPVVVVVLQVACNTGLFQLVGKRIVAMAILTSKRCVTTVQQKVSVPGVIEAGVSPICRVVAILAFFTAAPVVLIIFSMAAKTCRRGRAKGLVFVAIGAGNFLVFPDQWIFCGLVIKHDIEPVIHVVAIGTVSAGKAVMYIVVLMAGVAIGGRVAMFLVGFVTISTGKFGVSSNERMVRKIVIKGLLIEYDDRSLATLMIRMTIHTTAVSRLVEQTVKTNCLVDIQANLFVALDAQSPLLTPGKWCMA